jgi:hypothetical protein
MLEWTKFLECIALFQVGLIAFGAVIYREVCPLIFGWEICITEYNDKLNVLGT